MKNLHFICSFTLIINTILDKYIGMIYNSHQYLYLKEDEYLLWTLATVAPNPTETILFYSNTDVETRPVRNFSAWAVFFVFLNTNILL